MGYSRRALECAVADSVYFRTPGILEGLGCGPASESSHYCPLPVTLEPGPVMVSRLKLLACQTLPKWQVGCVRLATCYVATDKTL